MALVADRNVVLATGLNRRLAVACDMRPRRHSDNDLVHMAQLGDPTAFPALWLRHVDWIRHLLATYVSVQEDLDDLLQEVSLRIHRGIPSYRTPSSFTSWTARIARNVAIDWVRRSNVRRLVQAASGQALLGEIADLRFEPSALFCSIYLREELRTALRSLPSDLQQTVALRYFHGLSTAEVASALDCPQGTVKSRLHAALTKLRTKFTQRER